MGPSSLGEVLAGSGGETTPVPEIIVNDADMSALFSVSLPDGLFGYKKSRKRKGFILKMVRQEKSLDY